MMNEDMTENILLSRLENLEAQLRRLKQMGLIMILAICGAFVMGQATFRQVIETRKIIIRHSNGKDAIVLNADNDVASLVLYPTNGEARAALSVNSSGSSLVLTPPEETVSLQLSANRMLDPALKPIGEGGSIMLLKTVGGSKKTMLLDIGGEVIGGKQDAGIYLYGPNQEQTRLLADQNGQRLQFLETPDLVRATFSSDRLAFFNNKSSAILVGDTPSLTLTDAEGYSTTVGQEDLVTERTGEKRKTSAASVVLFGKDRKVIWRTP